MHKRLMKYVFLHSLKNTGYSAKSDEEMEMNQEDSVQQLRMEASQACNSLAEGLEQ
ncbi:hypothetical protein BCR32DRAFT_283406 [Anaeromyces robustus]|uniref:Uncharacterized protein n=1 Tax=Anaeromyces robustus TaxID=1754192 RepID=A0A1Y1WUH2_9FUNG|nr:hypothetical protein BCR32DRAFT_283406 [Anaeromyces robustus]|eukprot:ORX77199.1 hypothetical protein BCR32DRAFT_283406 [Anaeromyces robustus]